MPGIFEKQYKDASGLHLYLEEVELLSSEHLLHGHVLHGKSQLHRQGITEQLIKCHYLSVNGSALPANHFTHVLIVLVDLIVIMTNFVFIQS